MSLSRILNVLRKDVRLGPRSPIFLWTLVLPFAATLLVQVIFGSLLDPNPRLGVVDLGDSEISRDVQAIEGIQVALLDDPAELKDQVEAHDLDAGLILQAGFDESLRAGEKPPFEFYISGQSARSDRAILAVTALDLVRQVEGSAPLVDVALVSLGEGETLAISERLIPLLVLLALVIAGVFLTSFTLVEERERHTLEALLVTPLTITEVLVSKAVLGLLLALAMAVVTLALNGALSAAPVALLLSLLAGAVMSVEIGLLYGTAAKDTKSLYTLVKSLNLLVFAPVIFYLFPDWPQWIAKLFPTYWFLEPIFEVAVNGAGLGEVWFEDLVSLAVSLAFVPVIILLGRGMQARLGAA